MDVAGLGEDNPNLWRKIVDSNQSLRVSPDMIWKQNASNGANIVMQFYNDWGSGHAATDCYQIAFTGRKRRIKWIMKRIIREKT